MNNKGYTLVELLISMAITAIVVSIVISFLASNSKSYTYAVENVNLQMESQTVMNQLYDIIIESNWIELIDVDSNVKALIIYNTVDIDVVFLSKSEEELYLVENQTASDISNLTTIAYTKEENLMATSVIDLKILPIDQVSLITEKQICLVIDFENSTEKYTVERNVKFRNLLKIR